MSIISETGAASSLSFGHQLGGLILSRGGCLVGSSRLRFGPGSGLNRESGPHNRLKIAKSAVDAALILV